MKYFKQLIKNKRFFSFILTSTMLLGGIIIFVFGLSLCYPLSTLEESSNATIFTVSIILLGATLSVLGYLWPIRIIKDDEKKTMETNLSEQKKKEAIENMQGIRLATNEEKAFFIKQNKMISVTNVCLYTIGKMMVAAVIMGIIFLVIHHEKLFWANVIILFGSIALLIILKLIKNIKKRNEAVMNKDMYIVDCYAYQKEKERVRLSNGTIDICKIKVTDGNYFLDKWFGIGHKEFNQETINVRLYISQGIDIFHVVAQK